MGDYTFLQQPAIFTFDFGGRRKENVPMCRCADVPMRKTPVPAFGGIICHLSSVICHPSSVIRHLSSVIRHLSSTFFRKGGIRRTSLSSKKF
jgi:hypothetical protein